MSNSLKFEDDFSDEPKRASRTSLREKANNRKRARDKERAGKMFTKQFAGSTSSDASQNGPRAAFYKGEMGRSHRKAARMQASGVGAFAFAPIAAAIAAIPDLVGRVFKTKALAITVFAIACVVFACVSLYGPAQQYYQAVREGARLEAEYQAVQQRNDLIAEENASLSTDAGIETELRERYNYVKADEETANVAGLSAEASRTDSADSVTGIVASGSVKAPETWYSPLLDKIFGYTD